MIYGIGIAYRHLDVMAYSIARYFQTGWTPEAMVQWFIVNGHWPMSPDPGRDAVLAARFLDAKVLMAPENLGGHGNFSWALKQFEFKDDDYILNMDLNANPQNKGWLRAALDVMAADPRCSMVGLLHNRIVNERKWDHEVVAGHRIVSSQNWASFKTSLFRGSVMREGLGSTRSKYYGFVEEWMFNRTKAMGMRQLYLLDFREDFTLIPDPKVYNEYKAAHAFHGYDKTFEQYLKELK